MEMLRRLLQLFLPLVLIGLWWIRRQLAIDRCLDIGGRVLAGGQVCLSPGGMPLSINQMSLASTTEGLFWMLGAGALLYWATLFRTAEKLLRVLLGLQTASVAVVALSVYLVDIHHTVWQPALVWAGWFTGLLASIAAVVIGVRDHAWRWLWTIPAALALAFIGFVLMLACCLRMGS